CSTASASAPRWRRGWRSLTSSRAGTIRAVVIPLSSTWPRSPMRNENYSRYEFESSEPSTKPGQLHQHLVWQRLISSVVGSRGVSWLEVHGGRLWCVCSALGEVSTA